MTELKPCPFCGSGLAREPGRYTNASFSGVELMLGNGSWFVWCGTCCCEGRRSLDKAEAIAAWNTRAAPRADGDDGELVEQLLAEQLNIAENVDVWTARLAVQAAARITALSAEVERLDALIEQLMMDRARGRALDAVRNAQAAALGANP